MLAERTYPKTPDHYQNKDETISCGPYSKRSHERKKSVQMRVRTVEEPMSPGAAVRNRSREAIKIVGAVELVLLNSTKKTDCIRLLFLPRRRV